MSLILLPNQLFPIDMIPLTNIKVVYLIEEPRYFTDFKFHKLKLMYHRASMKKYMSILNNKKFKLNIECIYVDFYNTTDVFYKKLNNKETTFFNPIDHKLENKFSLLLPNANKINNLNFLLTESEVYDNKHKFYKNNKYHHDMFYKFQRKKLNILMHNDKPIGDKWSFDSENRKSLPDYIEIPKLPKIKKDEFYTESLEYVNKHFAKNYGSTTEWNFPIDSKNSILWLKNFMSKRLPSFGKYQDAVDVNNPFLFHSVLSPMMNIGILPDALVISIVNKYYEHNKDSIPISSYEGFIRQIIGWRNYMYSIYLLEPDMFNKNFLNHTKKIDDSYWLAITGMPPIDCIIKNIVKYAFAHHIERLMFLGNWFLINRIDPKEVYRIFMEWTVDAYDWVMIPNIFGMSQYADGGKLTSRIYIASSNYICKMSNFDKYNKTAITKSKEKEKENWQTVFDSIYYSFINKNYSLLKNNYATSRQTTHWKNKTDSEKAQILMIATNFNHT